MATTAFAQLLLAVQEAPPPSQHLLARSMYMFRALMHMAADKVISSAVQNRSSQMTPGAMMTAGHLFEAVSGLHARVRLLLHAVDSIRQAVALLSLLLLSLLLIALVIVPLHRGIHCFEAQLLAALVQLADLCRSRQIISTCDVSPTRPDSRPWVLAWPKADCMSVFYSSWEAPPGGWALCLGAPLAAAAGGPLATQHPGPCMTHDGMLAAHTTEKPMVCTSMIMC